MRNLKFLDGEEVAVSHGLPLTATAWDVHDDSIICAFGPTNDNAVIELKRKVPKHACEVGDDQKFEFITSWDAPSPLPELECDEIVLLQYFTDSKTVCVVLAGGDLVLVREDPLADQEKIEIVGSIDAGISAAAWAPDQELLAVVTGADTLILMSRDLEPVSEATLSVADLKISKHVSVGWGKKETQFHGKRAKALRDPTMPEIVDEGKLSSLDDGRTTISWRGDGSFLAINSILQGRRAIRVFTREAVLDSVSEPVDGLESALSWKPSGNVIAGMQRKDENLSVVFFERNGLRHGEFSLRFTQAEMETWGSATSLSWNVDSNVVAVCCQNLVQLWTMSNYCYYLKQEISLPPCSMGISAKVKWHPDKALRFSLFTSDSILDLEYYFHVCKSSTVSPHDNGCVAVIDGKTLKLTPLRYANVPPPMAHSEISASDNIIDCCLSPNGDKIGVLTRSTFEIHSWKYRQHLATRLIHCQDIYNARYLQMLISGDNIVYTISPQLRTPATAIRFMLRASASASSPDDESGSLSDVSVPSNSRSLHLDASGTKVWTREFAGLTALTEDASIAQKPISFPIDVPGDAVEIEVITYSTLRRKSFPPNGYVEMPSVKDTFCISLSRRGELYAGTQLICIGCTSFLVIDTHLIFTTSQHLLKVVHMKEPGHMSVPADAPEVDERCRSIERGARLVTVMPSIYAVVLQMPRGNLETIYPRVLVLAGIRRHLLDLDYKSAFLACQIHQVDLNILHDYRSDLFMTNILLFIEKVKKPSRIDEFLSKLKEEDVSQTLYKDTSGSKTSPDSVHESDGDAANGEILPTTAASANESGKANRICEAFISVLGGMGTSRGQNLITAHVSKRPPALSSALALVSAMRIENAPTADSALSHLVFLTDATRLYSTALAIYDLELALLVAQQAQMDPREYLPFLQHLHSLPDVRRRFEIDDHLKNHSKALASLHSLSAHGEVESYTVKHALYVEALDLYKYSHDQSLRITALYATCLHSQSRYLDAAVVWESLGDYASAYPSYALAHRWRESLSCATLIPLAQDQLRAHAQSLSATLTEELRDFRSAAAIQIDYLSDVAGGARLLCKGSYFSEATRVLALHQLSGQIPHIVDGGLNEKFGEITGLLAECKAQINAQIPRIKVLQEKRDNDPLAFYGGDPNTPEDGVDVPDNISLAPTDASTAGGQSLFTRYGSSGSKFGSTVMTNMSRKTSRTKRREERKRARGKKGSVYEEEYLIASAGRLIEKVNSIQEEVGRLIEGLLRRGMRERAIAVDETLREVVTLCMGAREELDSSAEAPNERVPVENGDLRPSGADGVLWDSQAQGTKRLSLPEVKRWSIAGLLMR